MTVSHLDSGACAKAVQAMESMTAEIICMASTVLYFYSAHTHSYILKKIHKIIRVFFSGRDVNPQFGRQFGP